MVRARGGVKEWKEWKGGGRQGMRYDTVVERGPLSRDHYLD